MSDPVAFPTVRRTAYVPESELLVVEWDLPKVAVVPEIRSHRYVKTRNEIDIRPVAQCLLPNGESPTRS